MIIYNKLDNYFVVSADRQTFWGSANLRDISPLTAVRRTKQENSVTAKVFTALTNHFWFTGTVSGTTRLKGHFRVALNLIMKTRLNT